jgi:hypothetical protein
MARVRQAHPQDVAAGRAMIPTYEDILNAIAKAFLVAPEVAAYWLTEHVAIGMRDEFAMAALSALGAYLSEDPERSSAVALDTWWARRAYGIADAMLAERAK